MLGDRILEDLERSSLHHYPERSPWVTRPRNRFTGGGRPSRTLLFFVGDFYQLPPVGARYPFLSPSWGRLAFETVFLTILVRQKTDAEFAGIVSRARTGSLTSRDIARLKERLVPGTDPSRALVQAYRAAIKAQKARKKREKEAREVLYGKARRGQRRTPLGEEDVEETVEALCIATAPLTNDNSMPANDPYAEVRVNMEKMIDAAQGFRMCPIYLFSRHELAGVINRAFIALARHIPPGSARSVPSPVVRCHLAHDQLYRLRFENGQRIREPLDALSAMAALNDPGNQTVLRRLNHVMPAAVEIREGCQYLVTANIDFRNGIVNGTRCKFIGGRFWIKKPPRDVAKQTSMIHDPPTDPLEAAAELAEWKPIYTAEKRIEKWVALQRNVQIKRTQVMLRPGYAITIHGSQGMTLDEAFVDLQEAYANGMGYVAISRLKTREGLHLLSMRDRISGVSEHVRRYYAANQRPRVQVRELESELESGYRSEIEPQL